MNTSLKAPRTTALSAMRLMLVAAAGLAITACSTGQRVVYNDGDDMYFSKEDRMPRSKQAVLGRYIGDQVPDAASKPEPTTPGALANTATPGEATKTETPAEDDYYNPNYRSSRLLSGTPSDYRNSRFGSRSRFADDNFRLSPVVGFGGGWGGSPMYSPFYDSWAMGGMYGDPFWGYNTMWPGNRFSIGLNYGNMWCPTPWGGNRFVMTTAGYDPYLAGYYHTYNYNPYAPYPFMGFNQWNTGWGYGFGNGWNNWGYGNNWGNNGWNNGWNSPVQPAPITNAGPTTIKGPGQAPGAAIIGSTPVNTPFTNANGVGGTVTKNPVVDGSGPRGLNPNNPGNPGTPGPADVIDLNQAHANQHSHAVVSNGNIVVPNQPGSSNSYLVRPSSAMIGSTDNAAFPVYNNANLNAISNGNGVDNGYVRPTRESRSNNWGNYERGGTRSSGSNFGSFSGGGSGGGGGSVGGSSPNVGSTGGGR